MNFTPKMMEEQKWKPKTPISTSLEDDRLIEFDKLKSEFGLNRSQLLRQMVEHCLEDWNSISRSGKRLR